ncbi:hypothetical protein BJY04DRAFT_6591 [Aspergillus karnatakaensis]|uniref:uncharacterized protein n=1 Tax=Aspergillus karnatakaensis TaxID=1810916 RepID=UPI003CCDEB39
MDHCHTYTFALSQLAPVTILTLLPTSTWRLLAFLLKSLHRTDKHQTQHHQPIRPQPRLPPPLSSSTTTMSSSVQVARPPSSGTSKDVAPTGTTPGSLGFDIVRCSRCQRSMSLESESTPGVVRFGMNSYYCSRCASMVGFNR